MSDEHRRAKRAFGRAMKRWRELPKLGKFTVVQMTAAETAQVLEEAHATAVEALLWARAFSDAASGCDGIPPLPGYPAVVRDLPEEMRAARYVANKGVHSLVELASVQRFPTMGPRGMVPHAGVVSVPMLRWVSEESSLPQQVPMDTHTRPAFANRWLGQIVDVGLVEVEDFLARW